MANLLANLSRSRRQLLGNLPDAPTFINLSAMGSPRPHPSRPAAAARICTVVAGSVPSANSLSNWKVRSNMGCRVWCRQGHNTNHLEQQLCGQGIVGGSRALIRTYIYRLIHTHMHTNTHTYIPTYITLQTYIDSYISTHMHTYTHTHTHGSTYTHIHIHIHT